MRFALALCYKPAMQNERELWTAVLGLAIEDLKDGRTGAGALHCTRLWFVSDDYEPGSFLWICDHLELDASAIRRAALESRPPKFSRAVPAIFCQLAAWSSEIMPFVFA
jgi:hypothetical protein